MIQLLFSKIFQSVKTSYISNPEYQLFNESNEDVIRKIINEKEISKESWHKVSLTCQLILNNPSCPCMSMTDLQCNILMRHRYGQHLRVNCNIISHVMQCVCCKGEMPQVAYIK